MAQPVKFPIPEWLNESFLSSSLQGGEECEARVEVKKFSANLAAPAGSNYGAYVLRVKVDFTRGTDEEVRSTSVIIKSPVEYQTEAANEVMKGFKDVEPIFYYKFLPEARKLSEFNLVPMAFYSSISEVVVLEDLKEKGFLMADRKKQLDLDHCRLYAVAAATLHAVSVAVSKVNPGVIESLGAEKMFAHGIKSSEIFIKMIPHGIECFANHMDKTEFKKYSNVVRGASPKLWNMLVDAHKPSKVLNTVNQGDPWVTNMMFKYDDSGNVYEIKLLDFQVLRFGSPLNDLVFFLWSGANNDVRENGYEEFFRFYCDTFNSKSQELGCSERLSYTDLWEGVKALSPLSMLIASTFLPLQVSPVPFDFDKLFSGLTDERGKGVNQLDQYYNEQFCSTFLPRLIKQLEFFGVFDFLANNSV